MESNLINHCAMTDNDGGIQFSTDQRYRMEVRSGKSVKRLHAYCLHNVMLFCFKVLNPK